MVTPAFAAIVAGRQRIVWHELPVGSLAIGLGIAVALRSVHAGLFAHGGLWVIGAVIGGGALATWQARRRAPALGCTRRLVSRAHRRPAGGPRDAQGMIAKRPILAGR